VARDDVARVRAHYAQRGPRYIERFSDDRPAVRGAWSRLAAQMDRALEEHGVDLASARVLDVGCGGGRALDWATRRGARPGWLLGADLVVPRLIEARGRVPAVPLLVADGARLPLRDGALDLCLALTSFSSMPSEEMRRGAATELLRVLRPGGLALCYDFLRKNPWNPYTVPIGPNQLREWFAGADVTQRRVTLYPALAHACHRFPRVLAALERVGWLRSHCLAVVRKPTRD
jgi:SAM-dependent methyltransferase